MTVELIERPVDELVEPEFFTHPDYVVTLGDEVADLATLAGFAPDPEQRLVLDPMFGLGRDGKRAAKEVVVIGPRQNIKTGPFKQAALGEAFLIGVELLVWSAHEYDTAHGAFVDLCTLIESTPELDARVKHRDAHRLRPARARSSRGPRPR